MKIVVLGAGLMGRAVVYDLAVAREVKNIVVADFDRGRAQKSRQIRTRHRARRLRRRPRHQAPSEAAARLRRRRQLHAIQLESGRDARSARRSRALPGSRRPLSHDAQAVRARPRFPSHRQAGDSGNGRRAGHHQRDGSRSGRFVRSRRFDQSVQRRRRRAALRQSHRLLVFDCDDSRRADHAADSFRKRHAT